MQAHALSALARKELVILRMDYVTYQQTEVKVLRAVDTAPLFKLAEKGYVTDVKVTEHHMWYTLTEKATHRNGRPLVC